MYVCVAAAAAFEVGDREGEVSDCGTSNAREVTMLAVLAAVMLERIYKCCLPMVGRARVKGA